MKVGMKSGIVLVFTLLIGIMLGILIDRPLVKRSYEKRMSKMHNPRGFIHMMERLIEPVDENQQKKIRKIIEKYSPKFHELNMQGRKQITALVDEMHKELDPILTEEQKARLKERMERFRKRGRDKEGPPYGKERWKDRNRGDFKEGQPVPPPPPTPLKLKR